MDRVVRTLGRELYLYGTGGVLRALEAAGMSARDIARRAADWLRSVQQADGGFGETCASYDDESKKSVGVSTPSQTAWALIGLMATGEMKEPCVERAIQFLLTRQNADGSWDEDEPTGTGFPRVFYLKYHLYRNSFPGVCAGPVSEYAGSGRTEYHSMELGAEEFRANRQQLKFLSEVWGTNALSAKDVREDGWLYCGQENSRTEKISDGADAGAAARVQFDVHGLRPHPGVQVHD